MHEAEWILLLALQKKPAPRPCCCYFSMLIAVSNLSMCCAPPPPPTHQVIEKAYKKLRLDALVIQQGRLTENTQAKVRLPLFFLSFCRCFSLQFVHLFRRTDGEHL